MKKWLFVIFLGLLSNAVIFAVPNYNNGNGTIISESSSHDKKIVIRKCIFEVIIGDLLEEHNRIIFDAYVDGKEITELKDNDKVTVLEICTIEYFDKPKDEWGNTQGELWCKIQKSEVIGWIHTRLKYLGKYTDPYYNNRYEILGYIENRGRIWTVRTMDQTISVWNEIIVRDNPGFDGEKIFVLHELKKEGGQQENYTVVAMTEEAETINGLNDYWLKIEYIPGKYGWIYGGDASVERGGPKYYIPDWTVEAYLRWY